MSMSQSDAEDTIRERAVASFARGILQYFEDGNVIELHPCGCIEELRKAAGVEAIAADEGRYEHAEDLYETPPDEEYHAE